MRHKPHKLWAVTIVIFSFSALVLCLLSACRCCYCCYAAAGLVFVVCQVLVPQAGTRPCHAVLRIVYIYIPFVIYLRFAVHSVLSELSAIRFTPLVDMRTPRTISAQRVSRLLPFIWLRPSK